MALHTAQLMCIVVFVIIVTGKAQSINDTQQLQEKAQQFYCTAVSLKAHVSTILRIYTIQFQVSNIIFATVEQNVTVYRNNEYYQLQPVSS